MKKRFLLFSFVVVHMLSMAIWCLDALTIPAYLTDHFNLEPGDRARRHPFTIHGAIAQENEGTLSETSRVPPLVGSYTLNRLQSPKILYFISVDRRHNAFTLSYGCTVITHSILFEPKGYSLSNNFKSFRSKELMNEMENTHYVKEVRYGGSYTLQKYLHRSQNIAAPPDALFLEFERDSEGKNQFKEKLFEIFWAYREFESSGFGSRQSPNLKSLRLNLFGALTTKDEEESAQTTPKANQFKSGVKKLFTKKKRLSPEEVQKITITQSIETVAAGLDQYVNYYLQEMPSGNGQIIVLEHYPIFDSDMETVAYDEVPNETYGTIVPELGVLAKKYTVDVFRLRKGGPTSFLIQIYPNERGEYRRSIRHDTTWIHAQASGEVSEDVLKAAFSELKSKLLNH